jgi:hypothetical protein
MSSKTILTVILYCRLFLIILVMFNDIRLRAGEYKCVKRYGFGFQVVKQCAHFHNMRSSHILVTFVLPYGCNILPFFGFFA